MLVLYEVKILQDIFHKAEVMIACGHTFLLGFPSCERAFLGLYSNAAVFQACLQEIKLMVNYANGLQLVITSNLLVTNYWEPSFLRDAIHLYMPETSGSLAKRNMKCRR